MSDKPLIFDIHLDLAMNALEWNRDLRWSQERIRRWEQHMTDKVDRGHNTVCFPEMRRGNVGLCVATQIGRYSPYFHKLPGWNSPEQAWAQTQGQLAYYRIMTELGEMTPIRNREELDAHLDMWQNSPDCDDGTPYVVESKKKPDTRAIGYMLSLEGADSIVTIDYLERSYEQGLRALGPAHYGPGRYAHGTDAEGPLTPQGVDLIKEMQRLGIILDVTHLNDETFWQAVDLYDGPLWASHQNARVLAPWNRQFADDQIKEVINRGGLLGMAFDAIMLVPGWRHLKSDPKGMGVMLERICDHVDHTVQMAGSTKHVCVGTDLDGGYGTEQTPMDMNSIADLQKLPDLFRARGYSDDDIEGMMWRNVVEFLRKVWG